MKCCTGVILEVDLSTNIIKKTKVPNQIYEKVLSGKGLAAWYLYKYIPSNALALGKDNIIAFVSGALTGTGALMCGRWMVCSKSPLTGGWGDANCGGNFSPAIKQCGYDGIFIKGVANKPKYLYIDNKVVELRDATKYWGKDATETEEKLIKECWIKKKPKVAVIGQAGENLSLISGICNDKGRMAARSGLGAVMGSKKLKAVVLAGSKKMPCGDYEKVKRISKKLGVKLKKSNMPNFMSGHINGMAGSVLGSMPATMPLPLFRFTPFYKKWGTPYMTNMEIKSGDGPIKNWGGSARDVKGYTKNFNADKIISREIRKYHCYSCGMG